MNILVYVNKPFSLFFHLEPPASLMPEITLLYFAAASTATGLTTEQIHLPFPPDPFPLSSLAELIISRHPSKGLDKVFASSQWGVDAEMVEDPEKVLLYGGEEVAVICPVSGG